MEINTIQLLKNKKLKSYSKYLVKEQDKEVRYLIAQSILKANPELASYVTAGVVDYTKGDVTNIPVENIEKYSKITK